MYEKGGENITQIQFFALSYLYSEELKRTEKEQFMDDNIRMRTHHSHSRVTPSPIGVSIRELAVKLPISMITQRVTTGQMLEQLQIFESNQLLEPGGIGVYRGEYTKFSITADSIMFLKSIFAQLSQLFKDNGNRTDGKRTYKKLQIGRKT